MGSWSCFGVFWLYSIGFLSLLLLTFTWDLVSIDSFFVFDSVADRPRLSMCWRWRLYCSGCFLTIMLLVLVSFYLVPIWYDRRDLDLCQALAIASLPRLRPSIQCFLLRDFLILPVLTLEFWQIHRCIFHLPCAKTRTHTVLPQVFFIIIRFFAKPAESSLCNLHVNSNPHFLLVIDLAKFLELWLNTMQTLQSFLWAIFNLLGSS